MSDHEFSLEREAELLLRLGGLERVAGILDRHLEPGAIRRASEYHDKQGADGWWVRQEGRPLAVDWKLRQEDHADLVIEWDSRVEHGIPGWTIDPDKITDYVLYLWPHSARLLPSKALRVASVAHRADWELRFGVIEVTTEGRYTTRFTPVPDDIVLGAMSRRWEPRDAERVGNADGTWGELGWFTESAYREWG
jgi:hypothetical protein